MSASSDPLRVYHRLVRGAIIPSIKVLFKDSTQVINVMTLIKGSIASATATTVPTTGYANSDAYPNCQSYTLRNYGPGNLFFSKSDSHPSTAGQILAPGDVETDNAGLNSLPLISFYLGTDTNNCVFTLDWNYT